MDKAAKRRAIEAVYNAASSHLDWHTALYEICRLAKVPSASLSFIDRTNRPREACFAPKRLEVGAIASYVDDLAWHESGLGNEVAQAASILMRRYAYPQQAEHYPSIWSITLRPTAYLECKLALHAHATDETPDELGILAVKQIAGHIVRATRISHGFGSLTAMHRAMHEMLDQLPVGLILFGRSGRLLHVNAAAFTLTSRMDGIVFTRGGLKLARSRDQKQLDALIERAIHEPTHKTGRTALTDTMALARPAGNRPLSLKVTRIPFATGIPTAAEPRVFITLTDPETRPAIPIERVRSLYSLSTNESRLALCLAEGDTLQSAAVKLDIQYETARKYLSSIFRKTETNRQSELVRLLTIALPCLTGRGHPDASAVTPSAERRAP